MRRRYAIGPRLGRVLVGLPPYAWLVLFFLVFQGRGHRAGTAGFGVGVSGWDYALTQCRAIILYLKLAVWPHPLVVDYGMDVVKGIGDVLPQAIGLVLLLGGAGVALWRRPALGFLGAWFFLILAPSSSVVPLVTQTIAEHRMYLPLAAVVALAVCGGYSLLSRLGTGSGQVSTAAWRCYVAALFVLSAGLGYLTARRNVDYCSPLSLWSDTVAHCPANPRAHNNLGAVLLDIPGRLDESVAELMEAIRLKPDYAPAHSNLGTAWFKMPGHMLQAEEEYRQALRLDASIAVAHDNLGNIWQEIPGRLDEAIAQHEEALRLNPELASAHTNLATALSKKPGRLNDALAHYRKALRLDGTNAAVHFDFGKALRQSGDPGQAMSEFQAALALDPAFAPAHVSLGVMLAKSGKLSEAAEHFRLAISADPANADAHNDLGNVLYQMGRLNEAEGEYNKALELSPALDSARRNLGIVQDKMRRDAK